MHNHYNSAILNDSQNQKVNDIISDLKKLNLFGSSSDVETFTSGGGYVHTLILCKNGHIVAIHFEDNILEYSANTYVSIDSYLSEEMQDRDMGFGYEFMQNDYDNRNIDLDSDTLRFFLKVSSMKMGQGGSVKKDKYGFHVEPEFKVGDKVTYAGYPAEITKVHKGMFGRYSYDVSYNVGNGGLNSSANFVFNKSNEIKLRNDKMAKGGSLDESEKIKYHVERAKKELLEDVKEGIIPDDVESFSDLNDYVDANSYGGFFEEDYELSKDFIIENAVHQKLNEWIQSGGLKSKMAKGGSLDDLQIDQIARLSGVRSTAIKEWVSENNLTSNDVSNIMMGLGRKQIKPMDFTTAIVGKPNNKYSKEIIMFAKSNSGYKMETGGGIPKWEKKSDNYVVGGEGYSEQHIYYTYKNAKIYYNKVEKEWLLEIDNKIIKGFKTLTTAKRRAEMMLSNPYEKGGKMEEGGVIGQEIVFDDNGEENTGVIKDVHEITGNYIVLTNDGRTVLADKELDVISLGKMRMAPEPKKRFSFFENGGELSPMQKQKFAKVMNEWKKGKLHSGSKNGPVVTDQDQAVAIAFAQARGMKKMENGGDVKDTVFADRVYTFLVENGYDLGSVDHLQDGTVVIYPSTTKVGSNRKDFFDGLQIIKWPNGSYEVSEYMAGPKQDQTYIYKLTKSLNVALKDLIRGNNRKPVQKYELGGHLKPGDIVEVKEPNYGFDSEYYVVADKMGYDEDGFLISATKKREQGVWDENQLKKIYANGGGVNAAANSQVRIRDWYMKNYPTDELGPDLNRVSTFEDLWNGIHLPMEIYVVIGVADSLVRERLFSELSDIKNVDIDYIYNKWTEDPNYAQGGNVEENNEMFNSQIKEAKHHIEELSKVVNKKTDIEPWVLSKMTRAKTDLSDLTHYLDGLK